MFDTLFCNARIVDGTGTPWFWGSVSVQDGFIAAVLPRTTKLLSRRTVDLEGGILCPGFVDGHSHSGRPLLSGESTGCKTMQGVATEKLGLDGMSPTPMRPIPIFWGGTGPGRAIREWPSRGGFRREEPRRLVPKKVFRSAHFGLLDQGGMGC